MFTVCVDNLFEVGANVFLIKIEHESSLSLISDTHRKMSARVGDGSKFTSPQGIESIHRSSSTLFDERIERRRLLVVLVR